MAGPNVVISVLAETSKFKKDMDEISSIGDRVSGALGKIAKIGAAALLAATVAVAGFLGASIKAAGEAEKIAAQTTAVIQSTAGAAGQTLEAVGRLADQLSILSGVDDELIQKGANVLLTFTNIRGTNFDAATRSALDMSVALGQDLQSAATLVGKALNDPIQGLSALQRVGVQFTEQQKSQIEVMIAAGDTAGAQAVILAELNRQFGGSAEAFGNTWEGALGRFRTTVGNIQETIGGAFLPVLTTALNGVSSFLREIAESPAFQSIVQGIAAFASGLLDGSAASSTFAEAFRVISAILNPFGLVLQALLPVLPTLQDAFVGLAQALGGGLVAILPALSTLLNAVVGALSGVLAAVLPVLIGLLTQLAGTFADLVPIVTPIINLLAGILADAMTQLAPLIALVANALGEILSAALSAVVPLIEGLAPVLTAVLEAASPLISIVISLVTPFLALLEPIAQLIGALLPPLIELLLAVSPVIQLLTPLLELLTPVLQFVADALANVVGFVVDVIDAFVALISGSEDANSKIRAIWTRVLDFFRGIPKAIGDFFAGAVNWLVDAGRNIIQGLLNGISSLAGNIGRFFLNLLPGWIVGPFKLALGIASPSRVFQALGQAIPQGLIAGVSTGLDSVRRAAGSLAGAAVDGFSPTFSTAGGGAIAGGAGGRQIHIHLHGEFYLTKADVGRAVKEALDEYDRLNGGR